MSETEEFYEVDQVLRLLGNPGRFQIIQFLVLAYQYIPLAMNDFMPIFYGLPPLSVRCVGDPTRNSTDSMITESNQTKAVCSCPNGYIYEYPGKQWSIIADMNLICDKAALVNLASVIYFLGQMLSTPLFGWSADKFGRRPTLLLSNLLYTILTIGLVFSRDYTSFVLLRFFVGVARQGMNSSFFILLMEWTPPDRRGTWAALAELSYTFGVLLITLVAFLLQNWRHIQAFLAAATVLSIPIFWFAPESLTWLCLHSHSDQVLINCKTVAKFNSIVLDGPTNDRIRRFAEKAESAETTRAYSFLDCFRTPNIRRTTMLCCFSWLACYFGYLGSSYLSSEIASDVYLNLAINGLVEFIPILGAYGVASRFGNKLPLVVYFLIGGVCSVVAGAIPGRTYTELVAQNIMAVIGRMFFVGTCCVIFVFTSELFPTVIRNNGFSLCSIALRIGCVIAPLLPLMSPATGVKGSGFLLVGIVGIIAAGSSALLRETKGKPLPDTIQDAEKLGAADSMKLPDGLRLRRFAIRKSLAAPVPIPVIVTIPTPDRRRVD
ncbi:putative Solute carrier family 22 member 12 [Hypsibius exemplaris]|uniref:Solute carrier family 22 member 12 n=1 Tax=Hypsibius exemplaris TaxID=2072580 RepID=A0A1W0XAJ8_HYPEX|nr:putative Solute carrier family 22 member 12 [Hypsibius exemplaris]